MDAENLVRMANRIGEFFSALPDHAEACDGVATHLRRYWEPRMRRQILALVDRGEAAGLTSLVREALVLHRAELEPAD